MSFSSPKLCSLFKAILGYNQYIAECNENEYQEQITLTVGKKKTFYSFKNRLLPSKSKKCVFVYVCMYACVYNICANSVSLNILNHTWSSVKSINETYNWGQWLCIALLSMLFPKDFSYTRLPLAASQPFHLHSNKHTNLNAYELLFLYLNNQARLSSSGIWTSPEQCRMIRKCLLASFWWGLKLIFHLSLLS